MGEVVIRLEGLGKKFSISNRQESYKTLRDTLANAAVYRPIINIEKGIGDGQATSTNMGLFLKLAGKSLQSMIQCKRR